MSNRTEPTFETYWGDEDHPWYTEYDYSHAPVGLTDEQLAEYNGSVIEGAAEITNELEGYHGTNSEELYDMAEEAVPRLVWEWCQFFDARATTSHANDDIAGLITFVLHMFHEVIIYDGAWEVEFMMPCARAVRSRLYPEYDEEDFEDEYP